MLAVEWFMEIGLNLFPQPLLSSSFVVGGGIVVVGSGDGGAILSLARAH